MSLLNSIASSTTISSSTATEVYICPAGKTHAIVDLSFLKDDLTTSSLVAVGLSTESNPAALTSVDFFIDDIEPVGATNSLELSKVVVGQGQRLYVKLSAGSPVHVRVSGMEENNAMVLTAGRLAATAIANTAQTQLWHNNIPNTAYASVSVTAYNVSTTTEAIIEMWVGSSAIPTDNQKVTHVRVPASNTTIAENLTVLPGERIFVRSNLPGSEFFINGIVVSLV